MWCAKFLKNEKGTSMIIFALVMTTLLGASAIVIDIGNVVVEKHKFQNCVDAAALAAAQVLPDKTEAVDIAKEYAQLNGYSESDIEVSFSDDSESVSIKGTKEVNYFFAKLLGFDKKDVQVRAIALLEDIGGAFDYVLFSGSTSTTLSINGKGMYVKGNAHTNKNFIANGSEQNITGTCEAVTTITVNGTNMQINERLPNSPFIEMPDFSETIRMQAEKAGQYFDGDKTFSGSYINVDSPIYVNGNLTINGSHFKGKGCILATGKITFNGSNLNASTKDAVCFYSKSSSITINGTNAQLDGIVYAPNGTIIFNGSDQLIHGRAIGNTLKFNGGGLQVIGGVTETKSLPSHGVKLIQ